MPIPPFPPNDEYLILKGGDLVDHDSAALCADGRVLYVWTSANTLYYSHYPNLGAFLNASNADATAAVDITAAVGAVASVSEPPKATVATVGGALYMVLACRTPAPGNFFGVLASPSGNGESSPGVSDWAVAGTLGTFSHTDWDRIFMSGPCARGSKWVIGGPSGTGFRVGVWTSENGAAGPWTQRVDVGHGFLGGDFTQGEGRNVLDFDGLFIWASHGNVTGCRFGNAFDTTASWEDATHLPGVNIVNGGGYFIEPLCVIGGIGYLVMPDGRTITELVDHNGSEFFVDWTLGQPVLSISGLYDVGFPNHLRMNELLPGSFALTRRGRLLLSGGGPKWNEF